MFFFLRYDYKIISAVILKVLQQLFFRYGPPVPGPAYGPPNPPPSYGPPNPPPVYGPPPAYGPASSVQVFYGVPHAMLSFWDKLKLKLDLFTVGKILLKLVIFKKIVSFIAILCLLLFIPALKHKKGGDNYSDEDDMMRRNLGETNVSSKFIERSHPEVLDFLQLTLQVMTKN